MGFGSSHLPSLSQRHNRPVTNLTVSKSEPSHNVFRLLSNPDLPFSALCEYINTNVNPIIYEARVMESRVYIERGALVAPHRKTILKIKERNGRIFWLQLERKPTSRRALVKGLGTTAANDQVRMVFS